MKPEPKSRPAHNSDAGGGVGNPRERILLHPESYIGPVEMRSQKLWVHGSRSLTHRVVSYVPGLYNIFDQILLFAAGNKQLDPSINFLSVEIDVAQGRISVNYKGDGMPIDIYTAEKIFGHLSDHTEDITALKTGYSVKLVNIFSKEFVVEIVDNHREKKYRQVFSENMGKKSEPQITVCLQGVNWTRITFKPDLAKFNMTHLDDDILALMKKRVLDLACMLGMTVQVVYNGYKVPLLKSLREYVYHYIEAPSMEAGKELPRIYERVNDQWEVCVTLSEGFFQQVSFVNNFATTAGGTHVDYVSNQIAARVAKFLSEELQDVNIEEHEIKKHLWVFINALIEDPTFDSPTKEALTTPQESFGSRCEISDKFVDAVAKCGVLRKLFPETNTLGKKTRKKIGVFRKQLQA